MKKSTTIQNAIFILFSCFLVYSTLFIIFTVRSQMMVVNHLSGDQLNQIKSIMSFIASHQYKENIYDCSEFSRDLVYDLKLINISAYCVVGFYDDGKKAYPHTWVEVRINNTTLPIEATSGTFIDLQDYKTNYKILQKGICS